MIIGVVVASVGIWLNLRERSNGEVYRGFGRCGGRGGRCGGVGQRGGGQRAAAGSGGRNHALLRIEEVAGKGHALLGGARFGRRPQENLIGLCNAGTCRTQPGIDVIKRASWR